ncbi:MAG: phospholipid carrier-dependent glycosyltransferase [bacterium]|nr:phospholipid carrier-dependent glycosyltransferase [bacterium]
MKRSYCLLLLLSLFLLLIHMFWLSIDLRPPSWDAAAHLNLCLQYRDVLNNFDSHVCRKLLGVTGYYPPVYHLSALPFLALFGYSLSSACLVNLFYLLILVWATYGIGKKLYNEITGVMAAFLVSAYPYITHMTNTFVIDLALASMVTLGMYLYLRSEDFTKKWPSILFGLVCGIGVLVKWTYVFFLAGPLLYTGWHFFTAKVEKKKIRRNIIIAKIIALVIALPWYTYNLIKFIRYSIRFSGIGANEGDPVILSLSSWLYYCKNLLLQIQPMFLVIFIIGFLIYLVTWKRQNKIIIWWIAVPYIILTLIRNKDERYTLPFLAAVSIISCFWIANIKKDFLKYIFISLIVAFGITQYFVTSFGQVGYYYCQPPHPEDWQQKAVCDLIIQTKPAGRAFSSVSVVANQSYWHSETLQFYADAHQLPILFKGYSRNLGQFADYIITKSGDLGPSFSLGQIPAAREAILLDPKNEFHRSFRLIGCFALPDYSWLYVFKREVGPKTFAPRIFDAGMLGKKLAIAMSEYFNDAEEFDIEINTKTMAEALQGHFSQVVISAKKIKIGSVWLSDVSITINALDLNLPLLWDEGKLIVYAIGEIRPSFNITVRDLGELLQEKAKSLRDPLISIQHGVLNLEGNWEGIRLGLKAGVVKEKDEIYMRCFKLKAGWLRIPRWFYQGIVEKPFKLSPTPEWPVKTVINEIKLQDDKIIVN